MKQIRVVMLSVLIVLLCELFSPAQQNATAKGSSRCGSAWVDSGNVRLCCYFNVSPLACSAHRCAIKFVGRPTNETDLVVVTLGTRMRPRKLVAAKHLKKSR